MNREFFFQLDECLFAEVPMGFTWFITASWQVIIREIVFPEHKQIFHVSFQEIKTHWENYVSTELLSNSESGPGLLGFATSTRRAGKSLVGVQSRRLLPKPQELAFWGQSRGDRHHKCLFLFWCECFLTDSTFVFLTLETINHLGPHFLTDFYDENHILRSLDLSSLELLLRAVTLDVKILLWGQ